MPIIRAATSADAETLALLAERTFRDTFAAENRPADIDQHCLSNFGEDIQLQEVLDPNYVTIVADHDGELVAFAQVRLHSPKRIVRAEHPAELHRLYVTGDWHGRGIAHEIMSAVLAAATLKGADALWLSVWERNPRAIAFYRKHGFNVVGDRVFQVGTDPQRDLVMAVEIDDQPVA